MATQPCAVALFAPDKCMLARLKPSQAGYIVANPTEVVRVLYTDVPFFGTGYDLAQLYIWAIFY